MCLFDLSAENKLIDYKYIRKNPNRNLVAQCQISWRGNGFPIGVVMVRHLILLRAVLRSQKRCFCYFPSYLADGEGAPLLKHTVDMKG